MNRRRQLVGKGARQLGEKWEKNALGAVWFFGVNHLFTNCY